ncbi:hypothetical protein EYF80_024747 [Liparis tanakae]|uniref:ZNRF-3 ectodomain domain-containing protein n=1 Tax=Liparis tanakae TaxID=230148 RepID=A0A4Z2HGK6_9TELE|nr:hypothetical protein EYF80_024747 [Liparis tanakae]
MRGSPVTSAHSHMKRPTGAAPTGRAGWGRSLRRGYHPLSLCNTSEDERQESPFITIVKLEHRVPRCLPLLDKSEGSDRRGLGSAQRCYVASGSEPWLWM